MLPTKRKKTMRGRKRPEMTNITHCPYTGIKKMRYLFMAEHMPEQLKELKRQGMPALDAYMDQVQKDYGRTITEYVNHWDKTHQHLKKPGNWDPWLKGLKMAEHQAEEIAIRNVIEAL